MLQKVEDMVFDLLYDSEAEVIDVAVNVLLPLFADWSDSLDKFCTSLCSKFLSEINNVINKPSYKETANISYERDADKLTLLFDTFGTTLPRYSFGIRN